MPKAAVGCGQHRPTWDSYPARRAPPAALDPSGHGVVSAVLTQQTVRAAHVTDTGFHLACSAGSDILPAARVLNRGRSLSRARFARHQ